MKNQADVSHEVEVLRRSLEDIRLGLAADGYLLVVDEGEEGSLEVAVEAGPDACEDCLVPKQIFHAMILDVLAEKAHEGRAGDHLVVRYPGEKRASATRSTTTTATTSADAAGPGIDDTAKFASAIHTVSDWQEMQRLATAKGWTDGLPVIPPTRELVIEFLESADLAPDDVVAKLDERNVAITAEGVAVNAVMAGAEPADMRLITAAVRAVADPAFKFNHLASLGSPWPLLIVSGPVVEELRLHQEHYLFGPDAGRNAVISRAFSLVMRNLALARNDGIQRGQWGNPVRWQCVVSELRESPWEPLALRRGFASDESALMAVSVYPSVPLQVAVVDTRPERMLDAICHTIAYYGGAQWTLGLYVLMFGPHHAQLLSSAGWGPSEVREYVIENTKTTVADLKMRGLWGFTQDGPISELQHVSPQDWRRDIYMFKDNGDADEWIAMTSSTVDRIRDVEVVVTGGDAGFRPAVAAPYQASTNPVIEKIR